MITFQENTHFSQALPCTREEFWEQVRKTSTAWSIDARRAIMAAVEASKTQGTAAIQTWLNNSEYQKFLLKKQNMKKKAAKEAWAKKTDGEKLLSWAQNLKENLPAFIFSCREFDETETAKGGMFRHRRLADCHLNGLVMLDIDHVENPMQIWWKLREMQELMDRVALVHISCSGDGIRIIFTADLSLGNLADNQIVFAKALGYKADSSCIDASRTSFCPKEEDILFINEEILFNYYDEEFDKRFTPEYRQKKTQPTRFQFDTGNSTSAVRKSQSAAVASQDAEQGAGHVCQVDDQRVENVETTRDNIKWRGYDIQSIINARYADKLPCADDSNRHKESLKLATDLLLMLDGDKQKVQRIVEAQPWVQEIIEERDENVEQTVESAASCIAEKEKKSASPMPSKAMQEAVLVATGRDYREVTSPSPSCRRGTIPSPTGEGQGEVISERKDNAINYLLNGWGAEIEAMFDDFPLLKDVCAGLKRSQYPAAMFVAGGALMTLMTRCTYRFYHRP